jgi:hypothetical protein
MLPALTADVTAALPALDRERLAAFDVQIDVLVEGARKQGFPESTVVSILDARQRLYAERAAAWSRLVLHGAPLTSAERLGDDEAAATDWLTDRLGDAVAQRSAEAVGRNGSLPHFEAWFLDRNGSGETPDDLLVRAHTEYTEWLDRQGDAVVDEVMGLIPRDGLRGSVSEAIRTAVADFQAAAFGAFDERFGAYLERSVGQVAADDPDRAPEPRGLLHRLADRLLGETPAEADDATGLEYGTLSEFFTVTTALPDLAGSPDVTRIVDELERATGLDALEATVLGEAERRLAAVVNRETAFAFLSRFDGDVHRRRAAPAPVTVARSASETSVTFTRTALSDETWTRLLHDDVARLLEGQISHHTPSVEFVDTLCRVAYDALADDGTASLDKRVLRRLALAFHPDAGQDADEMNARTLSRLLEVHRAGRFEIRAEGAAVTILARQVPGSRAPA